MPAPTASVLNSKILAGITPAVGFPSLTYYLQAWVLAIATGVANAWAAWEAGLLAGDNEVSGEGAGTWSGSGSGGGLTQTVSFSTNIIPPFERTTDPLQDLVTAIHDELEPQFAGYASSYVFGTVSYRGTSTASNTSPGTFTATNVTRSLHAAKEDANDPSGIAAGIQGRLPTPPFNFTNGASKLPEFLQAVDNAITSEFNTWERSADFSGDTVEGSAAAVTGEGEGTSNGTGVIS